jgi:hypothetical protein
VDNVLGAPALHCELRAGKLSTGTGQNSAERNQGRNTGEHLANGNWARARRLLWDWDKDARAKEWCDRLGHSVV